MTSYRAKFDTTRRELMSFIASNSSFNLNELEEYLLEKAGMTRPAFNMTLSQYLDELEERGMLQFDIQTKLYSVNKENFIPAEEVKRRFEAIIHKS